MEALIGAVYMAFFVFTVWMWAEALGVPSDRWSLVNWTKVKWFVAWYVSGLLTFGLVPMGMAIYYYRSLRPTFRTPT